MYQVCGIGRIPKPVWVKHERGIMDASNALRETRKVYFKGGWCEMLVYVREQMRIANRIIGPQLAERADILVENYVPGTMARWGLDYAALSKRNPRLIYASCTGFGQTGPRATEAAFDLVIQALAGTMSITGEANAAPVRVGNSI